MGQAMSFVICAALERRALTDPDSVQRAIILELWHLRAQLRLTVIASAAAWVRPTIQAGPIIETHFSSFLILCNCSRDSLCVFHHRNKLLSKLIVLTARVHPC